jgi:hypothetical protein
MNKPNATTTVTPGTDDWTLMRVPAAAKTHTYAHTPGNIDADRQHCQDITVAGAVLGDFIIAAPDKSITAFMWSIVVTGANTARIILHNFSGDAVDIGTINWNLMLIPLSLATTSTSDLVTASRNTGYGYNVNMTSTGAVLGDIVIFSPGLNTYKELMWFVNVSTTNTPKVYYYNGTTGTISGTAAGDTWRVLIIKPAIGFPGYN